MDNRISLEHHIFEYSKKNKHNEDIPVYSVTNADGFCTEYFSKEVASKDKSTYKIVERGSFAYNPSRINVGSVDWLNCEDKVIVSPLYNVFKTSNEIDNDYLLFFLKSERCKFLIKAKASGSVRDNLKIDTLKQFTIPNISIDEQQRRSGNLKRIRKLIELNQTQLRNYENLIKSRFVEMFANCKNMVSLNDACSIITDGTHQPPKFQDTGIPFIFVSNLANNTVTYDTEKFISEETYTELYRRTPIEIGDILLSTVGSYGHPAVVLEDRKFLFQRHIAYLKPKRDMINSFYFHGALLAPDGQRQIEEKVKGIAQKTLNLSEIRKIVIPLPGINEQNEFESFVKQVDKSKFDVQKSIYELQTLYDSLTQKYFG